MWIFCRDSVTKLQSHRLQGRHETAVQRCRHQRQTSGTAANRHTHCPCMWMTESFVVCCSAHFCLSGGSHWGCVRAPCYRGDTWAFWVRRAGADINGYSTPSCSWRRARYQTRFICLFHCSKQPHGNSSLKKTHCLSQQTASKNIHVFLALSPSRSQFAQRFHLFPALLRYCTLDWFNEWSLDALLAVAETTLSDVRMLDSQRVPGGVPAACVRIHCKVQETSVSFKEELNRRCYATPADFLALLKAFATVLGDKQDELSKHRFDFPSVLCVTSSRIWGIPKCVPKKHQVCATNRPHQFCFALGDVASSQCHVVIIIIFMIKMLVCWQD